MFMLSCYVTEVKHLLHNTWGYLTKPVILQDSQSNSEKLENNPPYHS